MPRVAIVLLALAACRPSEERRVELRDSARLVLERACGECHIPGQSRLAAPLAVFDLMQPEWADTASDAQLGQIAWRLREPTLPSGNDGDGKPNDASEREKQLVEDYVKLELSRRARMMHSSN
jgi:hypothetical protein